MTERLQDITDQISHTVQLDGIVNSMRALAALRVRQAREALPATEAYAATVREALLRVLPLLPGEAGRSRHGKNSGVGIILFCAEQGFAGLFSEHILEAVKANEKENIFLVARAAQPSPGPAVFLLSGALLPSSNRPACPILPTRSQARFFIRLSRESFFLS